MSPQYSPSVCPQLQLTTTTNPFTKTLFPDLVVDENQAMKFDSLAIKFKGQLADLMNTLGQVLAFSVCPQLFALN